MTRRPKPPVREGRSEPKNDGQPSILPIAGSQRRSKAARTVVMPGMPLIMFVDLTTATLCLNRFVSNCISPANLTLCSNVLCFYA